MVNNAKLHDSPGLYIMKKKIIASCMKLNASFFQIQCHQKKKTKKNMRKQNPGNKAIRKSFVGYIAYRRNNLQGFGKHTESVKVLAGCVDEAA